MPSSPDLAARAWEPVELGELARLRRVEEPEPSSSRALTARTSRLEAAELGGPALPVAAGPALFEVSPTTGIPNRVLDPARRAAEAAGYAAGWAYGIDAARLAGDAETRATRERAAQQAQAARGRTEQSLAALTAAAEALRARSVPTIAAVEDLIIGSAFEIAEAIVGAALRDDPARGANALARALALVPAGPAEVVVALHPADLAELDAPVPEQVRLVPDGSLAPGDANATCGATAIDARVGTALERVREVLGQ